MKPVLAALGGAVLLASALVVASPSAMATTGDTPIAPTSTPIPALQANPGQQDAMQRDLHLSAAQVKTRLKSDQTNNATESILRAKLGKHYGGAWRAKDGHLVVATTSADQTAVITAAGAKAEVVDRSAAQLASAQAVLNKHATAAGATIHSWYVDPATNTVVVSADSATKAKAFATGAGLSAATVSTVTSQAPKPLADIRGGDQFTQSAGGNSYVLCSIGFSVNGGFVTAGHCGKTGTNVLGADFSTPLGTYAGSTFPGNDYAYVKTVAGWTPQPWVNNYSGGVVTVAGSQEAGIGASVCRSGRTSGWHCGVIQAKNATVNYSAGAVYGLTQTNACAEGGDSGGSWISGNQAQGITSGGSGDCTSGGNTFFQPINPTLSHFGVTLVTTGGGSSGGGNGVLKGQESGRCVDVPNSSTTNGTAPALWDCNGGANQSWTSTGSKQLQVYGNKCLDATGHGTADGTKVVIWDCNGGANQQWNVNSDGTVTGVESGKCLDVSGHATANGSPIALWTCTGGGNQKFSR
jgi:streptogrisin C